MHYLFVLEPLLGLGTCPFLGVVVGFRANLGSNSPPSINDVTLITVNLLYLLTKSYSPHFAN